jgi:hypothetical protein
MSSPEKNFQQLKTSDLPPEVGEYIKVLESKLDETRPRREELVNKELDNLTNQEIDELTNLNFEAVKILGLIRKSRDEKMIVEEEKNEILKSFSGKELLARLKPLFNYENIRNWEGEFCTECENGFVIHTPFTDWEQDKLLILRAGLAYNLENVSDEEIKMGKGYPIQQVNILEGNANEREIVLVYGRNDIVSSGKLCFIFKDKLEEALGSNK